MKRSLLLLFLLLLLICRAPAPTPFSYQFYNADGTAQTNPVTMTAWPPTTNGWTAYGTNIIYGAGTITLTPNTNGYGTNAGAFPNVYRLTFSNLNSSFYIRLPDTNAQVSLGSCLISVPQVAGPVTFYSQITNALGFAPLASNTTAIFGGIGYTPATNGLANLTNTLTDAALVGIHAYRPATNGLAALTNTLTDAALVGIHGYRPATNSVSGFTNVLGFTLQAWTYGNVTNALGFKPPTNPPLALTAVLPFTIPGSGTNLLYITNGYAVKTNWP